MPRKEWIPKNPYCKRSKLQKHEFESLVYVYFMEITGLQTRAESHFGYSLFTWIKAPRKSYERLSLQGIGFYFEKMSQYIWDKFVLDWNPEFENKEVLDDLLALVHRKTESISANYRNFYNSLDKSPLFINADNIIRSVAFYLLSARAKVIRGFNKDNFYLEFSRVFFLCRIISHGKFKIQSIYQSTMPEDQASLPDDPFKGPQFLPLSVCTRACNSFLKLLSEEPM